MRERPSNLLSLPEMPFPLASCFLFDQLPHCALEPICPAGGSAPSTSLAGICSLTSSTVCPRLSRLVALESPSPLAPQLFPL